MSIDNYTVKLLDDTLDEIEELADGNIEIEDTVHRARGYLSDIENSDDDLHSSDVQEFKSRVLDAIPSCASMKFRMDVEELLEKFKGVY